nr:rod shape-determining protein MreD [Prevotella sp.]
MDFFSRIINFVILLLVQALVLNHIHLFQVATPLLYVYMALNFQRNYPRWAILVWCFAMGLCIDIFSNTPGVAAASMTVIGFVQPYLLRLFMPRDSADDFSVSISSVGFSKYINYAAIHVFLYCLMFFTLETFNFFNWMQWLLSIISSTVLTLVLIIAIENFYRK